jgi:hypothetical protein
VRGNGGKEKSKRETKYSNEKKNREEKKRKESKEGETEEKRGNIGNGLRTGERATRGRTAVEEQY